MWKKVRMSRARRWRPDDGDEEDTDDKMPPNGVGTGAMRYQYMTPEDFGDDVPMGSADILKAFKGLSSTHGIPHVSNARGKRRRAHLSTMTM